MAINQKCPHCGNYVEGKLERSAVSKAVRNVVKSGGMKTVLGGVGSIVPGFGTLAGIATGAAVDALYGNKIKEKVDELVDEYIEDNEYSFRCPKCGYTWAENADSGIMSITPAVYDDVKKIIVDCLGVDESQVTYSASFMNDLGADDLDAVELIMRFESYFGISISDEEAERIHSVGDALECIDIALSRKRFMPESKEPESPNNEDNINSPQQILISSMSEGDMEYFNEFYEIVQNGEISERDTRFLAKIRVANGISEQRALELELLAKQQIHLSPKEQEYIDEYKEMVRSGSISDRDRRFLQKIKEVNGISDSRAEELEKMTCQLIQA